MLKDWQIVPQMFLQIFFIAIKILKLFNKHNDSSRKKKHDNLIEYWAKRLAKAYGFSFRNLTQDVLGIAESLCSDRIEYFIQS